MKVSGKRISYIDLLRVFAIFMMVQGHTIDTFLSDEFRSGEYILYNIWVTLRSYTAPIFFYTSGFVLSYLLVNQNRTQRIKKVLFRSLELILLGYLLRYPSHKIIDFAHVSPEGWKIFFTVDALHLIACGLFIIAIINFAAQKYNLNLRVLISILLIIIISCSHMVNELDWKNILPYPLAGYFYFRTGSYFPLFPYLSYIFFGALLGTFTNSESSNKSERRYLFSGLIFVFASGLLSFQDQINIPYTTTKIVHTLGILLVLSEMFKKIVKIKTYNLAVIKKISDKSLIIYISHLIILYGCAWFPGLYKITGKSFNPQITGLFVILMLILMFALVIFVDRFFSKKRIIQYSG